MEEPLTAEAIVEAKELIQSLESGRKAPEAEHDLRGTAVEARSTGNCLSRTSAAK